MGDSNRFQVMANFIKRNFRPCRIADVAGGEGQLTKILNSMGFNSIVIDPRKIKNNVPHIRSCYKNNMDDDFDLIIGLHPDEATETICHSSKPFIIVPCCDHWQGIEKHGASNLYITIERFFHKHKIKYQIIYLPITGKNIAYIKN